MDNLRPYMITGQCSFAGRLGSCFMMISCFLFTFQGGAFLFLFFSGGGVCDVVMRSCAGLGCVDVMEMMVGVQKALSGICCFYMFVYLFLYCQVCCNLSVVGVVIAAFARCYGYCDINILFVLAWRFLRGCYCVHPLQLLELLKCAKGN